MGAAGLTCSRTSLPRADLSRRLRSRAATQAMWIVLAYAALWIITLLGAVLTTIDRELAPAGHPHPTLHGSLGEMASIAGTNARVLSAPFLLAFFRFPAKRRSRQLGDLLVATVLGANALRVGLALGRWQLSLLPYVPQLPLEWLAAALAAAAWLNLRTGTRRQTTLAYLAAVLVSVGAAAAVETIATPHARTPSLNVRMGPANTALHPPSPISVRKARGGLPAPDRAPAPTLASRSLRSLPLAVARFRSAVWPALPDYVNHPRIPQRRDQE